MAELVDEMTSSNRMIQFKAENSMVKEGGENFASIFAAWAYCLLPAS